MKLFISLSRNNTFTTCYAFDACDASFHCRSHPFSVRLFTAFFIIVRPGQKCDQQYDLRGLRHCKNETEIRFKHFEECQGEKVLRFSVVWKLRMYSPDNWYVTCPVPYISHQTWSRCTDSVVHSIKYFTIGIMFQQFLQRPSSPDIVQAGYKRFPLLTYR